MKILFYDTETTGLSPERHGLLAFSGIYYDGQTQEQFVVEAQPAPGAEVSPEALKVNGYTPERIAKLVPAARAAEALAKHLESLRQRPAAYENSDKPERMILAGWNAVDFDNAFLDRFLALASAKRETYFYRQTLDVQILAVQYFRERRARMPSFSLAAVAEALGVPVEAKKTHGAVYDAALAFRVWRELTKKMPIIG